MSLLALLPRSVGKHLHSALVGFRLGDEGLASLSVPLAAGALPFIEVLAAYDNHATEPGKQVLRNAVQDRSCLNSLFL